MFSLTTLGTAGLKGLDGAELSAILQQPKRLALLVYLAVEPKTFHRRDTLLGLFWPELDQDHARAALRRALYFLRQTLGADVVVGRGDDEVGVDPARLWCDVPAFDGSIAARDYQRAMSLYRGEFLEGLYIQGAQDAEAWLDRERARLRDDASQAAWGLARDAVATDPAEVARLARRALDLSPGDDDASISLIEGLEARGERATALKLWRYAVDRIRADLGREPSATLAALGERLGRGAGVRRSEAVSSSVPERVVAVLPFVVRGAPTVGYLSEGMVDLLSTKLDGVGPFRTCEPALVVRVARERGPASADPELGRAVARELAAPMFVTGSVTESGGGLAASLGLYDSNGHLLLRAEARAASESGLFDLVDELVRRLVADFDSSAAGRLARLGALTTASLPALKAYLQGEHEFRLGRHLQALDAYRRATIEDRSFALAYYRLASSLAASVLIGPARQSSDLAYQHRDRLSDHDRLLIEAQHAWLRGHTAEAESRYAALTTAFPGEVEPWFLLGDLLFHTNPYRGQSVVRAREPFERALELDPAHHGALTQLARIAALEGRHQDLDRLVERAFASSPGADQVIGLKLLRTFALRRTDQEAEAIAGLAKAPGLVIARAFSDVALYVRDLDGAERLGRASLPLARSPELRALGRIILAYLVMARGRRAEALELARLAGQDQPAWALETRALFAALPFGIVPPEERRAVEAELRAWDPGSVGPAVAIPLVFHDGLHPHLRQFLLGLLRARASDSAGVMAEAEVLAELSVPAGAEILIEQLIRTLDAEALRLQGRRREALNTLERLKTDVWFQLTVGSPFFAGTYHRYLRAELLADAGRTEEALGWYATVAERSPYELLFLPAAERRQAELLARSGQRESALRHEARAKAIWREA